MSSLVLDGYSDYSSTNVLRFNAESLPRFSGFQNSRNRNIEYESFQSYGLFDPSLMPSNDPTQFEPTQTSCRSVVISNEETLEVPDFSDACLRFINEILMEEDPDNEPAMFSDYDALQAKEKSFYDALFDGRPLLSSDNQWRSSSVDRSIENPGYDSNELHFSSCGNNMVESKWEWGQSKFDRFLISDGNSHPLESNCQSSGLSNDINCLADSPMSTLCVGEITSARMINQTVGEEFVDMGSRRKKDRHRDNDDNHGERSNKHLSSCNEEHVEMEQFDDVLLSKVGNEDMDIALCTIRSIQKGENEKIQKNRISRRSRGKKGIGAKRQGNEAKAIDLRTLLTQCAQAMASFDLTNANEMLNQIRQHSTPYGDSIQRVSHYFANGLEARLAGTSSQIYREFVMKRISSTVILKAYRLYCSAIPFQRNSYFLANQTIAKVSEKSTRIHIIDFGISFGFQWPCLIQNLSKRENGPPMLRITGIDFAQRGFRPTERVEEAGHRLRQYCERFKVPFEYNAIAQPWETIKPEDLKMNKDELLVVNCMYQSRKLPDETISVNSPRDTFLKRIKNLNPNIFIHGVVNGTYNAPFFTTRFREALYHYSSLFDVFEATIPREDQKRLLIETHLYGKDAMNIVACEGAERVERPETYKQWQCRTLRAGFRQLPLEEEVVRRAKSIVKANYRKDFMVEQDCNWMLQGWKGRTFSAISCWRPA